MSSVEEQKTIVECTAGLGKKINSFAHKKYQPPRFLKTVELNLNTTISQKNQSSKSDKHVGSSIF